MLSLIDILMVLSSISAAQAGPMRRYTNTTTSQISHTLSIGVAYNPAASVPALSLAPIQGITTLPLSLIAEAATESHIASDAVSTSLGEAPATATTTDAQPFKYEPLESGVTTSFTQHKPANAPTSFWTFGDENRKSTVTLTSTSIVYEYAQPSAQAGELADPKASQIASPNAPENGTTTTCEESMSQTSVFTFDPVPTTESTTVESTSALPGSTSQISSTSTTQTTDSSTTSSATELSTASSTTESSTTSSTADALPPVETEPAPESTTSEWAYPYPDNSPQKTTTASAIAQHENTNPSATSPLPMFSDNASDKLPEVVIESTKSQKQKQYEDDLATTSTTLSPPPGMTVYPSVLYITVTQTDAGATTTVTG